MVCWKVPRVKGVRAGGDRPSGPWEGPACDAECPTTERRAREGPVGRWDDRAMGRSSNFLFAGAPAQAVALELDAMSIVNDAIQDRIAESGVTEHRRIPQFLIGP